METNSRFGWGTTGNGIDTHLSKNVEWGAIAYLSKSIYGKNNEPIWVNPSKSIRTGCAGDTATEEYEFPCKHTYETENGVKASTTGTIYGIYDISAGSAEYTAAYINNGNNNLTKNGNSIVTAADKYKNVYAATPDGFQNNYDNAIDKKGDAVYETSSAHSGSYSWNSDGSNMGATDYIWFVHGGSCTTAAKAGLFNFDGATGVAYSDISFHPVLLVGTGL
jgi:hypothetical protein